MNIATALIALGIAVDPNGPEEQRVNCPRCATRANDDDDLGANIGQASSAALSASGEAASAATSLGQLARSPVLTIPQLPSASARVCAKLGARQFH